MDAHAQALARAFQHQQAGQNHLAEAVCLQIVQEDPAHAEAWNLLGVLAFQASLPRAAIDYFERARAAAPGAANYHANRGTVMHFSGNPAAAEQAFREALRLDPTHSEAQAKLSAALRDLGRFDEAEASFRRVLEMRPGQPEPFNDFGNYLRERDRFEEAEACYREALKLRPDYPDALYHRAVALRDLGRHAEAAASYRRAIELRPNLREAHSNLAMLLLALGDFEHGWSEYEWRWQSPGYELPAHREPFWDGSPLAGRTILLHPEQGYGDTIQFVRYAPLVKALGANVLLHCPTQLFDVLRTCAGVDLFVPLGTSPPPFDCYAPLLSLPRLFGTTFDTIPAQVPYLEADARLVARWRERMTGGCRVGIVWQGSPAHAKDRMRSVPLTMFEPLAQVPGVSLFSLQVGAGREQMNGRFPLTDLGGQFDVSSFRDAAAVLKNLDLLITVDTALAHLAGALGVPTWLALAEFADWRWLLARSDNPWYPTMRLFRQTQRGDWGDVFQRTTRELELFSRERFASADRRSVAPVSARETLAAKRDKR